jgi:[acyl-carrier-protein] S-malonyltransferase
VSNSVAFLYPGQGSQQVGMGLDLYQSYPEARRVFAEADRVLGFSLSGLCFEGPPEELNRDLNSQLAVYTVSCILTDLLNANKIFPDAVSGYSSGFYAAAYAAGCFDFARGLAIVRQAGEILLDEGQRADGTMAVIFGLSPERVDSICEQVEGVEVAILNTPRQTIISGLGPSVRKAMKLSLEKGALDAYILPVAAAYHSSFMRQSSARLLNEVEDGYLRNPRIPLISYLLLEPVPDKEELRRTMAFQLSHPVPWIDLIKTIHNRNHRLLVEVGPGNMISRTVRWIDRNIEILHSATGEGLLQTVERYRHL